MVKYLIAFVLSLTVLSYDEQKEIELIHGIVKNEHFSRTYLNEVKGWCLKLKIKEPKVTIIETTPSRSQGYYIDNNIYVYFSENDSEDDIKATLAHELGHHYIAQEKLNLNNKEQELKADKIAAQLIGKFIVTRNLIKRSLYHKNDKHPTINQRISSIYKNK